MPILGHGIDIVETTRIRRSVEEHGQRFLDRVYTPAEQSADEFRKTVLEHFNMPLGTGLGRLQDKIFRIGHLGDFNDLMLAGTLSGVEMGLELAGIPHHKGGIAAAMEYLVETAKPMHVTV